MEDDALQAEERGYVYISKDDASEMQEQIQNGGLILVKQFLDRKLTEWKKQPLNVAITGNSGSGKSSFINAIRDMTAEDKGAAPVNVIECTTEPTAYNHPNNTDLKFWDLPGVGTPDYPQDETYLEKVDFEKYDFFLIFCAVRFTENDLWLAKMVREKKKTFFFVRAKLDADMRNQNHPTTFVESQVLINVRNDIIRKLEIEQFHISQMFLISNFDPNKWDFPDLCTQLIENLPRLKKEAMVLSLNTFSKDMVKEKKKILENRIWKIATLSAAGAVIPFPGFSLALDITILLKETLFYKSQLSLDDESLSRLSTKMGRGHNYLKGFMRGSILQLASKEGIILFLKTNGTSMTVEEAVRYIPFGLGSILAGAISFATTYKMLYDVLEKFEEEACRVLEIVNRDNLNDIEDDE